MTIACTYPILGERDVLAELLDLGLVVADGAGDLTLLHPLLRGVVAARHHLALGLVVALHLLQALVLPGDGLVDGGRLAVADNPGVVEALPLGDGDAHLLHQCLPIKESRIRYNFKIVKNNYLYIRVGHQFFSKERSDLCVLFRSL